MFWRRIYTLIILLFYVSPSQGIPIHPAILRAREKLVERDRLGAAEILVAEIKKEKLLSKTKELSKELDRVTQILFTNEGQKNFELAEAIRFSGQDGALSKYEETLKLEPYHLKTLHMLAVLNLAQKKCDKAKEFVEQAIALDPFKDENKILLQRCSVCKKKPPTQDEEITWKQAKISFYLRAGEAQAAFDAEKRESAITLSREAIALDPQYPMGYYWAWKSLKLEADVGLDEAQRYLSLCKAVTPVVRKKYYLEPELCQDIESVEDYLKKAETNAQ